MEQFAKRKCGVTKPRAILPHLPLRFSRHPQPHLALPEAKENLLRMQPPPCSHSSGSRSPWTAFEKGFVSAQWVENEGLDVGKEERMLGQGRDGGRMMEERQLWTAAFPAPSRGRLGNQERRGKSI